MNESELPTLGVGNGSDNMKAQAKNRMDMLKEVRRLSLVRTAALAVLVLTLPVTILLAGRQTQLQTAAEGVSSQSESEVANAVTEEHQTGDLDGDGCVNFSDLKVLETLLGKKVVTGMLGDLNGDGEVTVGDVKVWLENFGRGC